MGEKAHHDDFIGRFREIVSDPLNLLIRRDPRAGFIEEGHVYLHNGLKVPISGPKAYYGDFSWILAINRGVHEPLEEFIFQELLQHLPTSPKMLELGAYWGHYSMWLKVARPEATVHLVESEPHNLNVGRSNLELNGIAGDLTHAFVGKEHFRVDDFLAQIEVERIDILHADIQGWEVEMLEGCSQSLAKRAIDYLFVSTHSQQLHEEVRSHLSNVGYRVEVSSDCDSETTSCDGFIFASSPSKKSVFKKFQPMSRVHIEGAEPADLIDYLSSVVTRLT